MLYGLHDKLKGLTSRHPSIEQLRDEKCFFVVQIGSLANVALAQDVTAQFVDSLLQNIEIPQEQQQSKVSMAEGDEKLLEDNHRRHHIRRRAQELVSIAGSLHKKLRDG
jgi:hypothetical protein